MPRTNRKSAVIQPPSAYEGASIRSKHKNRSIGTTSNKKNRSRPDQSIVTESESNFFSHPTAHAARRPYRYQRISVISPFGKSPNRFEKLAFCIITSLSLAVILAVCLVYVYYFTDDKNQSSDNVIIFSPTLPFTNAPTTTLAELKNITQEGVENFTLVISSATENSIGTVDAGILPNLELEGAIEKAFYYSEKVCVENEFERGCVAGSGAEVGICKNGGFCTRVQYHANAQPNTNAFDPEIETRNLDLTSWPSPNDTLCRKSSGQLGVCFGGECTNWYNGTRRFSQIEGQWRDNCDQSNPCWTTPESLIVESRNVCISVPRNCNHDEKCANGATMAVVWMEHRYCYMNPARAGSYCAGLPLRLWLCRFCRGRSFPISNGLELAKAYGMQACLKKYSSFPEPFSGSCILSCIDPSSNETVGHEIMPDGTVCMTEKGEKSSTGYCYKGQCFRAEASLYEEKLQSVEECERQKELDEQKWEE